ncbi:MAG: peptidoglycan-binding protein [Rivularia sp. (in: cyanobacteria)]|jgi:peptidoglycan hydrolase-like protein with peptidoglycan-binding domain
MDNLAYLHLAVVYEDPSASNLYLNSWLKTAETPDLKRFSSKAWRYMLPLVLTISILSIASSALALQKGDRGPSVKNLQQDLQRAGFYQAPVTQVYDIKTEDAVKRFQKAASIGVDGIAGPATLQKLEGWRAAVTVNTNSNRASNRAVATKKPVAKTAPNNNQKPLVRVAANTTKRRNPNLLAKGDEGEAVKALQERLRVAGFYYGNSTGIYGPITEDAVKRFQRAYGLDVDGIVGAQTLTKLPPMGVGFGEEAPKSMTIAATRRLNKEFLGLGDRGEPVRILQAQLIKAGYLKGQPNAYFGPNTADAVKRFQGANYLAASGIAGPTTRGKLYRNVNEANKAEFNVLEIQRRLQARGFYKGPLNGEMGKDTKKAIKQAQEFYGVSLKDVRNGRF